MKNQRMHSGNRVVNPLHILMDELKSGPLTKLPLKIENTVTELVKSGNREQADRFKRCFFQTKFKQTILKSIAIANSQPVLDIGASIIGSQSYTDNNQNTLMMISLKENWHQIIMELTQFSPDLVGVINSLLSCFDQSGKMMRSDNGLILDSVLYDKSDTSTLQLRHLECVFAPLTVGIERGSYYIQGPLWFILQALVNPIVESLWLGKYEQYSVVLPYRK